MKLNKAILPVAGLGTRFLPATKSIPKEMLPIVDTPLINLAEREDKKIRKIFWKNNSTKFILSIG